MGEVPPPFLEIKMSDTSWNISASEDISKNTIQLCSFVQMNRLTVRNSGDESVTLLIERSGYSGDFPKEIQLNPSNSILLDATSVKLRIKQGKSNGSFEIIGPVFE